MWKGNEYVYSKKVLKAIAEGYRAIYEGLALSWRSEVVNEWSLAEYKADFDMALNSIGKGRWTGDIRNKQFEDYRHYGRLQRVVIADIYDIEDLEKLHFRDVDFMKRRAYGQMAASLNSDIRHFVAKNT